MSRKTRGDFVTFDSCGHGLSRCINSLYSHIIGSIGHRKSPNWMSAHKGSRKYEAKKEYAYCTASILFRHLELRPTMCSDQRCHIVSRSYNNLLLTFENCAGDVLVSAAFVGVAAVLVVSGADGLLVVCTQRRRWLRVVIEYYMLRSMPSPSSHARLWDIAR